MLFPPILGRSNPQLAGALKRLSAAKYGRSRVEVEQTIFKRLRAGDAAREEKKKAFEARMNKDGSGGAKTGGSSFLDEWLAKRKQLQTKAPASAPAPVKPTTPMPVAPQPQVVASNQDSSAPEAQVEKATGELKVRGDVQFDTQKSDADKPDLTLSKLQDAGLGGDIDVAPGQQGATHTVKGDANVDEIFIDLKGTLHHKANDETAAK